MIAHIYDVHVDAVCFQPGAVVYLFQQRRNVMSEKKEKKEKKKDKKKKDKKEKKNKDLKHSCCGGSTCKTKGDKEEKKKKKDN